MEQGTFVDQIYQAVARIPYGRAATCGQVVFFIGVPRSAKQVGNASSHTPSSLSLPCHRVVSRLGRTMPGWTEQRRLLEGEGVSFREDGTVDLVRSLWRPKE